MSALDALFLERSSHAAALETAGAKLSARVKRVLRSPLKAPPPAGPAGAGHAGGGGGGGGGTGTRQMLPLFRQGQVLFCKGDCVTVNSDEVEGAFLAQLLSYDRVHQHLQVRWLYRSEEVDKTAGPVLQRYRRRHYPPDDVAIKDKIWNDEHEVFFSFHIDRQIPINSILSPVKVYFLEGYPLDAPVRMRGDEYYCRAGACYKDALTYADVCRRILTYPDVCE